ncbi:MAG: hypothetical protein V3V56_02945 [bacterium]
MSTELIAVIVGALIGVIGGSATTLTVMISSNRRRRKSILAVAKGEVVAIKEKAERYISGQSSKSELGASTPMLISIASELGFLSEEQIIALRRAVTLDMEMRKDGSLEKARQAVEGCEEALRVLN